MGCYEGYSMTREKYMKMLILVEKLASRGTETITYWEPANTDIMGGCPV